jgi:16S rRNA (adenine1518-N6/adenine1519-N6)-dimethyltransferase
MLQWRYEIERLFDVPAEAFEPPPRVKSGVLRMTPLAAPPAVDPALLAQIVTVSFSQRRKLLRHSLGRWLEQHGHGVTFDLQRRAEEVAVAQYVGLAQQVGRAAN